MGGLVRSKISQMMGTTVKFVIAATGNQDEDDNYANRSCKIIIDLGS